MTVQQTVQQVQQTVQQKKGCCTANLLWKNGQKCSKCSKKTETHGFYKKLPATALQNRNTRYIAKLLHLLHCLHCYSFILQCRQCSKKGVAALFAALFAV